MFDIYLSLSTEGGEEFNLAVKLDSSGPDNFLRVINGLLTLS